MVQALGAWASNSSPNTAFEKKLDVCAPELRSLALDRDPEAFYSALRAVIQAAVAEKTEIKKGSSLLSRGSSSELNGSASPAYTASLEERVGVLQEQHATFRSEMAARVRLCEIVLILVFFTVILIDASNI